MKVDNLFASRVARLAAEMVADGWPHGTFDKPDWIVERGATASAAAMRAGYEVWGGPAWWMKDMSKATACLRKIRYAVCDDANTATEANARERWESLSIDETVLMLLFASRLLASKPQ